MPPCDELVVIASTASWFFRLYYNNSEVLSMYGGTTGRHVARHGADPARPGGAPVDPTLGHDMFQRPRPVRVHGGPERPRSARASVRASGSSFMPTMSRTSWGAKPSS